MSGRDLVLMVGSAAIGAGAWLVWRDQWLTVASILILAPLWAVVVRWGDRRR